MKKFTDYVLSRTKERSTWMGAIAFLAAVGINLEPAQTEAIIATGLGLAGLISAFTRDA